MSNDVTATRGDVRVEAEEVSSPDSANSRSGIESGFYSIAVWGRNHTTNATVPIASLHWRGDEVHDDSMNSNGFYTVTVSGCFVIRTCGRVDGYGRKARELSKVVEYETKERAIASANSTILKKCARGYDTFEVNQ
jgi:predicted DNA-binding WGR domain protein